MAALDRPLGVVLDIDGVLWVAGGPEPQGPALLASLQHCGIPFCLLTNDCSTSKTRRHTSLSQAGFVLSPEQVLTAAEIGGAWLRSQGMRRVMYLGTQEALGDVAAGLEIREDGPVDAVVVGDMFNEYSRSALDRAARAISAGATLVALQRNAQWSDGVVSYVDNGFWVAGLEYVTGAQAVVTGKPSPTAYFGALSRLGVARTQASEVSFVSDDVVWDLRGAKDVGLRTVHYGPQAARSSWVDHTVGGISALGVLLTGSPCDPGHARH